ncbi:MAG: type IV pilin protein [Clostridiaceae bacterium]
MKKNGFTYIEVMIAVGIFFILFVVIMRLDSEANKNMNRQIAKQNMMLEAQKQVEKFKTTNANIGSYSDDNNDTNDSFENIDNYYVALDSKLAGSSDILYEVTVVVRKTAQDKENEVILKTHVLKD